MSSNTSKTKRQKIAWGTGIVLSCALASSAFGPAAMASETDDLTTSDESVVEVVDTTKPVVEYVGNTVFNASSNTFVVQATDDVGVTKIVANIYKDGKLLKSNQKSVDGAASADFTVNVGSLADGSYSVRFNALDAAGNLATTKTVDFRIDQTAPTVSIKPESVASNGRYKTVSFKLYDAGKFDYVLVNGTKFDKSNAVWGDHNSVAVGKFGGVLGENTIVLVDEAGNSSVGLKFVLDNVGPTLAVKPEGTVGSDGFYQKVSYKLNDPANVVKATLNGVVKPLSPNVWSDLNGIVPGVFGAVEGLNTLVLEDALGNTSEYSFTLDTTKPVINTPADGQWVRGVHTFEISQTEANPAKAYVEINELVNGKWVKRDGVWLYDTNDLSATFDTSKVADGATAQIKISTWDKVNLHTSKTFSIKVDNTAPVLTVKPESVGADGVYSKFSAKLYDKTSGVDYVTVNGVKKDLTNNTWSDLNNLKPGQNGAVESENTIVLYDVTGNASEPLVITLDTIAPSVVNEHQEWQGDKSRNLTTLTFDEPTTVSSQGWYAQAGSNNTIWTKAIFNTKSYTVEFADKAGNNGTYVFTAKGQSELEPQPEVVTPEEPAQPETPVTEPEVTQPETPTVTEPGTTETTPSSNKLTKVVEAVQTKVLAATGGNQKAASAAGAVVLVVAGVLLKLKSLFGR